MKCTGGCYCGAVRYEAEGEPIMRGQCHCRECQYIAGGAENYYMVMPAAGFRYVKGAPKTHRRADLPAPASREFCAECGTHLATRTARTDAIVIVKVGGLDDPSVYGKPEVAIWTKDAQPFHMIPDDVKTFEGFPAR